MLGRPKQQEFDLHRHGGKRKGAGRPRRAPRAQVAHRRRTRFNHRRALHVTLRMAPHVWNLRGRRARRVVESAVRAGAARFETRVVQISVMGNHLHLLVEAPDHVSLSRAMKGFCVRLSVRLNRLMGQRGRAMGDRYHATLLQTPTEVRHVAHYIRSNFRKHEAQRGTTLPRGFVDPMSSDGVLATCVAPVSLHLIKKALGLVR